MQVLATGAPQSRFQSAINDAINPAFFLVITIIFSAAFFSTRNGAPEDTKNGFSCRADDPTFPWQGNWNRLWDTRLFLSITLARGQFTFSQAKAIDIFWDLIIGRGGQMYVIHAAYQVMRRSLLRSLESTPMQIPVTTSLIFEGLSIPAFVKIFKDLVSTARKEGRWNWRLLGFLWMIVYLLSFGTIVSAMTGYQAQMTPYYNDTAGSLVESSKINLGDSESGAVVVDGQRIGLEPGTTLSSNTSPEDFAMLKDYESANKSVKSHDYSTCGGEEGLTVNFTKFDMTIKYDNKSKSCIYSSSSIELHNQTHDLETYPLDVRFEKGLQH